MKQLLIVNSTSGLNGGVIPQNFTDMNKGAIGLYHLDDTSAWLSSAPTKDFAIVLGRGANNNALVIPEVDFDTLSVVKANPTSGRAFSAVITIPTVAAGKTYTLVLVKNGTLPHERNTWTATETIQVGDSTTTAANIATKLGNYFKRMADTGSLDVTVTVASAQITITGKNVGEGWTLKGADALSGVVITTTSAEPSIGTKKYIEKLASMCAAGKGFTDTYADGDSVYPGYPEEVEDKDYVVYTLRFAVGRKSAKTRDERVSQVVHIAVPDDALCYSALDSLLSGIKQPVEDSESCAEDGCAKDSCNQL